MVKYTANQDIRDYMADHGVSQKAIATEVGVSVFLINQQLKTEMSQKEKEQFLNVIDGIVAEKNRQFAEEAIAEAVAEEEEAEDETCEEAQNVMVGSKFKIGDRVMIPSKQELCGVVSDVWSSLAQDRTMYEVTNEVNGHKGLYAESQLVPAPIPTTYSWEAHIDGNVAVVTMNAHQGDNTFIYARGHAHIIHDGEVGMAQAISFAARRMFEALDRKEEKQIYFRGDSK